MAFFKATGFNARTGFSYDAVYSSVYYDSAIAMGP